MTLGNASRMNTESSTEAELVAIDDSMAQVLWTRHFLVAAQGMYMPTTTIYQDNKSTNLMVENSKLQAAREHNIWIFGMFSSQTRPKKGEVKVAFCTTHNMLGEFFTKALQGTLFT